jgi:hypothetical protein
MHNASCWYEYSMILHVYPEDVDRDIKNPFGCRLFVLGGLRGDEHSKIS